MIITTVEGGNVNSKKFPKLMIHRDGTIIYAVGLINGGFARGSSSN